ncbi:MAG: 23S rRNA (adenine(2503)-C(2))-methyltransferase RlmN [Clostridia bacterium]|nr:23S rRNA (adenine(2503)-C(2))-methyltransferase RlmN [Clostridia bacterium]
MEFLQDFSLSELEEIVESLNEPKYRAKQIYQNLYLGKSLEEMTNVPKSLKEKLKEKYGDTPITIHTTLTGKDGTQKFVYKLYDGNLIEGVLMKYKYGNTLCVSCQVGCRMGCKFCASTLNGLVRNLSAGEILGQVLLVNKMLGGTIKDREITNIVMMGSGEPLDNYDNVVKFLHLVSNKDGINISPRNISVSTCGLVDKIDDLSHLGLPIVLTISLHAPNDKIRKSIMPIANRYSIKQVVGSAKRYVKETGRRVVFEYALTKGVNDTISCARQLAELLRGFQCHVNLIPLNEVEERELETVSHSDAIQFCKWLEKEGISATVRRTIGEDIEGACGQLRNKILKESGD